MQIVFHPEMRVVDAVKIARQLGFILRFRNGAFVLVRRSTSSIKEK